MPIDLPCGRCIGCRLERSRQWAMRCMHEASQHKQNCFVTLTYDEQHLPEHDSLRKNDITLFMKRLRAKYGDTKIRFYACGEYGDLTGRPHYHLLLFGFNFPDRYYWAMRNDNKAWRSPDLERLWTSGAAEIGECNFESAAYVARYALKKYQHTNPEYVKAFYGPLEPEFGHMSRGGRNGRGLGHTWLEQFAHDVYKHDSVIINGKECKPPHYYDSIFEAVNPQGAKQIKKHRAASIDPEGQRTFRLMAKAKIQDSILAQKKAGSI